MVGFPGRNWLELETETETEPWGSVSGPSIRHPQPPPPPPRPARLFDITSCICALGCRGSCRIRRHSRSRVCLCTCTHSPPKKKKKKRHNAHPHTFSSVCVGVYGWVLFGGEEEKKKAERKALGWRTMRLCYPAFQRGRKKIFFPLPILLRFFIQTLLISALYKASQNCADDIPPITFHPL